MHAVRSTILAPHFLFRPLILLTLATHSRHFGTNLGRAAKHFGHGTFIFGHACILATDWPRMRMAAVRRVAGQNAAKIKALLFFGHACVFQQF